MKTFTDSKNGKVYALGQGFYSRTVTQYPAKTIVWEDSATAKPTGKATFETQSLRNSWLRMMNLVTIGETS